MHTVYRLIVTSFYENVITRSNLTLATLLVVYTDMTTLQLFVLTSAESANHNKQYFSFFL